MPLRLKPSPNRAFNTIVLKSPFSLSVPYRLYINFNHQKLVILSYIRKHQTYNIEPSIPPRANSKLVFVLHKFYAV